MLKSALDDEKIVTNFDLFAPHKWVCRPGLILLKTLKIDYYNSLATWNVWCQLEDVIADKYLYKGITHNGDMLWKEE